MSELIALREFARRLNVSDTAIGKAVKSGRVTIHSRNPNNGRPLLAWPEARDEYELKTDSSRRTHVGGTGNSPKRQTYQDAATPDAVKPIAEQDDSVDENGEIGEGTSLAEARRRSEVYKAKLAKLDYEQKSAKLVDADEVSARWAKMIIAAKTRIMGIPAACKSRASDLPLSVIAIVDDVCREALENLADGNES